MNTMQNLVSRVAGVNNEELANHGIGIGSSMAYTLGAIGTQFRSNKKKSNILNKERSERKQQDRKSSTLVSGLTIPKIKNENNRKNKSQYSSYRTGKSFLNTGIFNINKNKQIENTRRNYGKHVMKNRLSSNIKNQYKKTGGNNEIKKHN